MSGHLEGIMYVWGDMDDSHKWSGKLDGDHWLYVDV